MGAMKIQKKDQSCEFIICSICGRQTKTCLCAWCENTMRHAMDDPDAVRKILARVG